MPERKKKKKKKKRKKKKKIMKSTERNDSVICPDLPDAIVFEILTRLPIKKLFQCKCVSKVWCSIIRDSEFVKAHRRRNPTVLIISVRDEAGDVFYAQQRFYYSILGVEEPQEFINSFNLSLLDCHGVTQAVNGLVCFHSDDRVFLGNIYTGETTILPDPPEFGGLDGQSVVSSFYYLGFDSVNGVYKLVKVRTARSFKSWYTHNSYQILTISNRDCSWRKLADGGVCVPVVLHSQAQSLLVRGVLYWICKNTKYILVSFDLSKEKFHLIKHPEHGPKFSCYLWLVQFRGRPSLFRADNINLILYTLDDHEGRAWTKHKALLPSELQTKDFNFAFPVGNLPSGEILLVNPSAQDAFTPVYAYNHENSSFKRFVVGKFPPSTLEKLKKQMEGSVLISCAEQNVGELDPLIYGGHCR